MSPDSPILAAAPSAVALGDAVTADAHAVVGLAEHAVELAVELVVELAGPVELAELLVAAATGAGHVGRVGRVGRVERAPGHVEHVGHVGSVECVRNEG